MLRSYHVQDYGWTPLSQNPCWKRRYVAFPGVTWITLGLRVQDHNIVQPICDVKVAGVALKNNFKYRKRQILCIWLIIERGIVRTRVAMCHDLLRLSLCSRDLCAYKYQCFICVCTNTSGSTGVSDSRNVTTVSENVAIVDHTFVLETVFYVVDCEFPDWVEKTEDQRWINQNYIRKWDKSFLNYYFLENILLCLDWRTKTVHRGRTTKQ